MLKATLTATVLFLASQFARCADDDPNTTTYPAQLEQGVSFDDAQACDAFIACPDGLECLLVHLGDPNAGPICIESDTICDLLNCGDGECLMLESYPGQVMCSGPTSDTPGDDGVVCEPACEDEGVDNQPGDEGNEPGQTEGSEPGNPGQTEGSEPANPGSAT